MFRAGAKTLVGSTGFLLGPGTLSCFFFFFSITDKGIFRPFCFLETKPKLKKVTEICKQICVGILHISERLIQLVNDFKNKRRHLILFYFFYFTVIDCRSEKYIFIAENL